MDTIPVPEKCALCGKLIAPGDKAIFRDIPDKGVVRRSHRMSREGADSAARPASRSYAAESLSACEAARCTARART